MSQKGISPIVAVVLLIAISVIASVGVWYWVGSLTGKKATPSVPGMMSVATLGNGKVLITNLGGKAINLTTLRTSDPHVWITMCDKEVLNKSGDQAICDLLTNSGLNESKTVLVYANGTNTVQVQVTDSTADKSLIGWWSFDDAYYNGSNWIIPDDSGDKNTGTLKGNAKICSGYRNKGVCFDGNGSYMQVTSHPYIGANATFIAAIKTNASANSVINTIMARGHDFWLYKGNTNNYIIFESAGSNNVWTPDARFSYNIPANKWLDIEAVRSNNNHIKLFVDGQYVGTNTTYESNLFTTYDMYVGAWSPTLHFFNGTIDEVMIFNRALNKDEINWLYRWGIPRNE